MKKNILLLSISFIILYSINAQNLKVGFYASQKPSKSEPGVASAFNFITAQDSLEVKILSPKNFKNLKKLEKQDVIWLHITDSTLKLEDQFDEEGMGKLRTFVEKGGGLLLSREAFGIINLLGLEPEKPDVVNKKASDNGYGRMLGFHAFRQHLAFDGLNGGAYVLKPSDNITVRNFGFFNKQLPQNGKVVATDWDYIFLRENNKLILEYELGKGKVLAVGAYIYFEFPSKRNTTGDNPYNVNRQHLEKFTLNCLNYLAGKKNDQQAFYWNFQKPVFEPFDAGSLKYFPSMMHQKPSHPWQTKPSEMAITKRPAENNYWDIAGERLLVMGKEKGGIDEIWAHPFMAFRDYEAGIRFSNKDSIFWLNNEKPVITVNPESFVRVYHFDQAFLKEIITVSPEHPQGVIHYEYRGEVPGEIFIRFKTNQRLMWPYSHCVLGGMKYGFHEELNAFVITDPSGDFTSMLGFNKQTEPVYFNRSPLLPAFKKENNPMGRFCEIYPADSIWYAKPCDDYILSGMAKIKLETTDNLDVVFAAGNEGSGKIMSAFDIAKNNPAKIYQKALEYQEKNNIQFLSIITPDTVFNKAYQWALVGSDRFFVSTPGLGSSLVAGYGTTASGWGGEHEINGRPGYAWYFGRDAVWSAFALLHYGDFDKVKSVLEMLQKYQDLNGKIYHELSTSGIVHYDASDATPLYVILAGRYLRHSGDTAFIQKSLTNIKKAIDYMYSTDTDGDGLIENTNVGHGWVEGGSLFGSHTSLYLAACWTEALQQAAEIYKNLGDNYNSQKYQKDADKARALISTKYWNEQEKNFYHGFKQDQSFITEKSIMPSIPILFGDVEQERAHRVVEAYSANAYTADWGARIVSENSPSFNPTGYHTGSVWPLYTGWVAMAEYKSGRAIQGFSHTMNNLLVYDDWAQGFIEEVLHGAEYKPAGVCHHQCWSQTMALQPAIEGMLGLEPNAPENTLTVRPSFPANWDTVKVERIKVGEHSISFLQQRRNGKLIYTFDKSSAEPLHVKFRPMLPAGTKLITKSLNGKLLRPGIENLAVFEFDLVKHAELELRIAKGIEVLPVYTNPMPGSSSNAFRIIDSFLENNIYTIIFEGRPEAQEEFSVYMSEQEPLKVEKAEMKNKNGNIYTYKIDFPESESKYSRQKVRFFLE